VWLQLNHIIVISQNGRLPRRPFAITLHMRMLFDGRIRLRRNDGTDVTHQTSLMQPPARWHNSFAKR
jgi:hypothetical protein